MAKHRGKRGDFWSKVDQSGGADACWPWIGSLGTEGYGQVRINKRLVRTHRVAYELTNGPLDANLSVCHRCDNPPCCNPSHLFSGTQADNMADCSAKGRVPSGANSSLSRNKKRAKGEDNGLSKLTEHQVREIRLLCATSGKSKRSIARRFGVTDVLIGQIVRGKIWKHVS